LRLNKIALRARGATVYKKSLKIPLLTGRFFGKIESAQKKNISNTERSGKNA
jgi:hypothetical protein